jgi:molybdate transport system substrate-binding protein
MPIRTLLAALAFITSPAHATDTLVAVAANFTGAAKEIATAFKRDTGHEAIMSFASSGQLYAQITQAAPFQVFLSADGEHPQKLIDARLADGASRFTYAVGKLVLWSKDPTLVKGEATLTSAAFARLAYANPAAAPYGRAAVQVLQALKLFDALKPKLVEGASIAQTFQFVRSGNAQLGFVARAQLAGEAGGSRWEAPQQLYEPIRQDAVLLNKGAGNEAAAAFMAFLKGPQARAIIEQHGYALE